MSQNYAVHLERQNAELTEFLALLRHEQAVLTATPVAVDELTDITEAKRGQAATLEAMENKRLALVADNGGDGSTGAGTALAERLGCGALWQDFLARVAEARAQNERNGVAITTRLEYTDRALKFFRRGADQALYAADGRRNAPNQRRIHYGV